MPMYSMSGTFTKMYPINNQDVDKKSIHGAYGIERRVDVKNGSKIGIMTTTILEAKIAGLDL